MTMMMQQHFISILQAAGVHVVPAVTSTSSSTTEVDDATDATTRTATRKSCTKEISTTITTSHDATAAMEEWLGVGNSDGTRTTRCNDSVAAAAAATTATTVVTVEDCLPLSPDVYHCAHNWLVEAWNTTTMTMATEHGRSIEDEIMEETIDPSKNILERWFPSVQATRYLCLWMECNLHPDEENEEDDNVYLLRQLLHVHVNNNHHSTLLLRALYRHVESLPLLLQHVYSMTRRRGQQQQQSDAAATLTTLTQFRHQCQHEWDAHIERLTAILHHMYQASQPSQRKCTRRYLGHVWQSVVYQSRQTFSRSRQHENTQAVAVRPTLRLLRSILLGASATGVVSDAHRDVLLTTLVALHTPNGVVLWRDQAPVLELYHEVLCQCCGSLLQQRQACVEPFLQAIANMLLVSGGHGQQQHSGKQVLLLHEIEMFLPFLPPSSPFVGNVIVPLLAQCIQSDHFRVAEQALQFFRRHDSTSTTPQPSNNQQQLLLLTPTVWQHEALWKALVRRTPSWNPTVRKMTAHVLELFHESDAALFREWSNRLFSSPHNNDNSATTTGSRPVASNLAPTVPLATSPSPAQQQVATDSNAPTRRTTSLLPRTVPMTGLPHRATTTSTTTPRPASSSSLLSPQARWSPASGQPPPLTVTGVAPWAQQQQQQPRRRRPTGGTLQPSRGVAPWAQQQHQQSQPSPVTTPPVVPEPKKDETLTGYDFVLQHIRQLKPKPSATSSSSNVMSETTTFLPTLQFHDLVFGHELGRGSFGTVQYAKHILKQQHLRSLWPAYAVKIVPQHMHRSFREIATLSLVSHPGVARLVSYFAFRANGVYMVLEYASRGDLQTLLQQQGSLDVDATRSVMGQVLAVLDFMHDAAVDLVYGDLKPENIVVTESQHVKLTDFGACRGATVQAKDRVDALARELQANVRDGDWKITGKRSLTKNGFVPILDNNGDGAGSEQPATSDLPTDTTEEEKKLDLAKVEGTTAYLPPEVVLGDIPTKEADCWAFGCVLYQCLTGRPPLLEADEAATKKRIVHFDASADSPTEELSSTSSALFSGSHAKSIDTDSRSLILALLDRDRSKRPGMKQVASHAFFSAVNVFALYKEPATPLVSGSVGPAAPNAQWARRQFSSIWAPQPKAYNLLSSASSNNNSHRAHTHDDSPIAEGDERDGYYTVASSSSTTSDGRRRPRSGNMLPPPHRVIVEE